MHDNGYAYGSWTPRGMVMTGLMAVLAAELVMSHFGVSTAVLWGVGAVGALAALFVLYWLPTDAKSEREDADD